MKILFYIDAMSRGGAQRVMSYIINHNCDIGNDIVLATDYRENINKEFPINQKVKRIYLRDVVFGNSFVKNMERVVRLRKTVKEEKPDIILSFLGNVNLRMLIGTVGTGAVKCVSVRNNPYKEYGKSGLRKIASRQIFKLADGVVFQTKDARCYFPKKVQRNSRIILNPVSDSFFDNENIEERHDIVAVGRLENQKNYKLLIKAFSLIRKEYPSDNLIIYGDGILRSELIEFIQASGLNGRVILKGNIQNVAEEIRAAKCFVMSSDYEGLPNALMEAMALGVPVISTDCPCGGPRTLIRTNFEGILVPVGDDNLMAAAMRRILSDRPLQNRMHIAEKQRANDFKSDIILQEWDDYFSEMIMKKKRKGKNK